MTSISFGDYLVYGFSFIFLMSIVGLGVYVIRDWWSRRNGK